MWERMSAGELYIADDPELARMHQRAQDLLHAYNATTVHEGERRRELLADLFGQVGEGVEVRPPLQLDYGSQMRLGARVFINCGLVALDVADIAIGDDVQIGPNVQLLTATHPVAPQARRDKWESAERIELADNVWLSGGVIVCPGVSIGENTVVGAGSVVVKNLPANAVAVGNPARVIRRIDPRMTP